MELSSARHPSAKKSSRVVLRRGKLVHRYSNKVPVDSESIKTDHPNALSGSTGLFTKILISTFVLCIYLPFVFNLGSIRITPSTIFLVLFSTPMVIYCLISKGVKNKGWHDLLVLFYGLWASASLFIHHGFSDSIEPAGILLLQSVAGYATGRYLIRNYASAIYLAGFLSFLLVLMLPFVIAESILERPVILEISSSIARSLDPIFHEQRLGMRRAQGPFEHPILFGVIAASAVSYIFYVRSAVSNTFNALLLSMSAVLNSFFSLSTGALLSLNIQFLLWAWKFFVKSTKKWAILAFLTGTFYITIDLLSNRSPFHIFVDYMTFNSQNSYNRILIWQFGTAEVWRNPILGIGMREWQRPEYMSSSMDNFWLIQAVRYGLPALFALFASFIIVLFKLSKSPRNTSHLDKAIRTGVTFSIIATLITVSSVHLWNNSFLWIMFLLGCCGFLLNNNNKDRATK